MAIYLKPKEFYKEIVQSQKDDMLTKRAEEMLILLANRTIKKKTYKNVADKEDCLQTGLMIMFTNWRCFDPDRATNPFPYFTEIFKRAMAKGYNDLYKKKGDPNAVCLSIESSNDGDGLYNF